MPLSSIKHLQKFNFLKLWERCEIVGMQYQYVYLKKYTLFSKTENFNLKNVKVDAYLVVLSIIQRTAPTFAALICH